MGLTVFLIPLALAALMYAAVLLAQGLRQRRREKLLSAACLFAILLAGSAVLMEFSTRPL